MGFSFSLLAFSRTGRVDLHDPLLPERHARRALRRLLPGLRYRRLDTVDLLSACRPRGPVLSVAPVAGGVLVATADAETDDPATLDPRWFQGGWPVVQWVASRSIDDMAGYARWDGGTRTRTLVMNARDGIRLDAGVGDVPSDRDWLDTANLALFRTFGLAGDVSDAPGGIGPDEVRVHRFAPA